VIALRDLVELIFVLGFLVAVPPLVERAMASHGLSMLGTNRILATGVLFILWAGLAAAMVALNREAWSLVGLARPKSIPQTVVLGLAVAACIFAAVVTLEHFGYGRDRLGDMVTELKGNPQLLAERMAISVLVVGFVEEFIFRGFVMRRIASLLGDKGVSWFLALIAQAALFGLSHGYQQTYGMVLTGGIGLFLGAVYLLSGRNLWIVAIGHGVYDAAHAAYIAMS
jgi:membrane protease YdiL (CAAX protease family)